MKRRYLFFSLQLLTAMAGFGQSLPVGTPAVEETWRRMQLKGEKDIDVSFTIRPLFTGNAVAYDSIYQLVKPSKERKENEIKSLKRRLSTRLLPLTLTQQYNSQHPFGWNDGSLIPAKGYQSRLSLGGYFKVGLLSIQLNPEMVFAQNKALETFPSTHSDSVWKSHYYIVNRIDNPERFGNTRYLKVFPGQSSIRLNYKKLSAGISTENLWWGPGVRNALLMSNNAPGFAHFTFNTTSPLVTPIGSFEWQVIAGLLQGSGVLPTDTARTFEGRKLYVAKPDAERYINGMVVTWQPKWTKGLHLGFARTFYQYRSNLESSFNGVIPVFTSFFKSNSIDENSFGRDQLFSLFGRLVLPESKAELYAEYGRNDHSGNLLDLILEPEHARAYTLGFRKIFPAKKDKEVELFAELTHLQNSSTRSLRALEGWYTHHQVKHGYTNQGQVMGAGIGPGGSSQTIGVNLIKNNQKKLGIVLERVVHNNDFYYDAFGPSQNFLTHWVDLSVSVNKNWIRDRFIYAANLSLIKSYNYEWQNSVNRKNISASLSVAYLLKK